MVGQGWTRREFFRRTAAAGALATTGGWALSACTSVSSGDPLAAAKAAGKIKIGIANEAPYGFTDASGRVTGEAPEVARAVFKALGIADVEAVATNFDGLIPGVTARQFDMVAAGMNITPARCGQVAFSIPDYSALTALLVPRGNPEGVRGFDDVKAKGLKLAVLSAAVEKGYAESAGVAAIETLDSQDTLLRAVADGRVGAAALTDISLKDLVKKNPDIAVEVTPGFTPRDKGKDVVSAGGFVFRKDDTALLEAFNAELKKLHQSGEWLRIVEPFGFGKDNLPAGGLTTEKLCAA
ncbi:amino acid ABC transporter substrate-binding protein, PAAT family [Actinokineospora alba]|uniref:Amino acid ABC transporter substrate-binding protein, PAAT family n=1 Tax=Actinokineospora alba TaxID=504798 RepID=A0A1H0HLC8_9PSEU|nr:ectoine/hydroxyectoine ABC transporter substrate-binding protein EhuB [Actinokineospora alba]TDP64839.1 polar amino acid transport system substrate-binding protein [Actinokineospora alba]SDH47206.1 polar amino acid transport system substrate-binding protein [Actinokineospora alba]SDO20018.1 amino acid ABC transporter substrate-binding protein, PAAT family [Actinokineospora alba]